MGEEKREDTLHAKEAKKNKKYIYFLRNKNIK